MKLVLSISDYSNTIIMQIIERMLIAAQKYGYEYKTVTPMNVLRHVEEGTIPVFINSISSINIALMEYYQACNVPYIYYIDDNFWQMAGFQHGNANSVHTLDTLVKNASGVLVNSEVLAEEIRKRNPSVRVLPAFYDFSVLGDVKKDPHPGEVRIGFPSCPSRLPDIEPLVPVIRRLLDYHKGRVVFEFVGVIPPELRFCEGVRYFESIYNYAEFSKFQLRRAWDIGLAPLRPTAANCSKTNNKYREYGACGIAGVYSDVPPYSCVQHRHTGLLVGQSSEDWFKALSELIDNPQMCKYYGQNAWQDVQERFSLEVVLHEWIRELDFFSNQGVGSFRQMNFPSHLIAKAYFAHTGYQLSRLRLQFRLFGVSATLRKMVIKLAKSVSMVK